MRETFLGRPYNLIQQPCGSSLGLSGGVGVNVHRGTYIRMSQQLLHILGCGSVREKVGRICMPQQMEMKIIHIPDFLSGVSAHTTDRCRGFISSIGPQADEGNLGVTFWWCLCPGQRIDLVVGAVLFLDDAIVVLGVQRPIFYAVQHLLLFGFPQDGRQGIAEIHSTDFLALCGSDLCFLPYGVIPHTPANGKALFLYADGIIEPPDRAGAAPKVSKLPLVNDEHDTTFANRAYEAYVQKIEKTLARLNYEASIADEEHKKAIEEEIKITKETVATMKLARDDMRKFISSFEEGESLDTGESTSDVVKGENKQ